MNEPCYQTECPSSEEVYKNCWVSIQRSVELKKIIPMNQKIAYRILDMGNISLIIKERMAEELKIYSNFGSYRGYQSSTRYTLDCDIKEKIQEYYKKKAFNILKNSNIIDNWINHILYSPGGLRYKIHKTSFESLKK
tara:strand:+ start:235 stop:645 length:411 start_codon:yes stop_codon:yes gene_type:complete